MHDIKMTSSDGVILNTSGKYCEDNIRVFPAFTFSEDVKRWNVIVENNCNKDTLILQDDWLTENKDNDHLCILFSKNAAPTPSEPSAIYFSLYKADKYGVTDSGGDIYQGRQASSPTGYIASGYWSVSRDNLSAGSNPALGYLGVTNNGELYIGGSSTQATIYAGTYTVLAWITN